MSYSSGTFTRPVSSYVFDTVISETSINSEMDGIATGLTKCLLKDGTQTVTANIPMATYKFTGLGAGSAATDSANLGQVQAQAYAWGGTAGGTADALTLTPTPAITAYAAGQRFVFLAGASPNTGAATVAISGLATKTIQRNEAALAAADIVAGKLYEITYDGTQFQLCPIQTAVTLAGTETLTNKTLTAPVISTITNTGTVTLPTASDTLVGRATTDTLTNKTLTAAVLGGTTDVSGGQLKFPATQSASADVNTLDDYEEGTWTPTDGSGATLSLTTANCAYTKIGRMITVTFNITYPSTADGTNAQINGLPFTVGTPGGGMISTHNVATPVHLFSAAAGSSFDFRNDSNGVYTNANLSTKLIYGALTYFV